MLLCAGKWAGYGCVHDENVFPDTAKIGCATRAGNTGCRAVSGSDRPSRDVFKMIRSDLFTKRIKIRVATSVTLLVVLLVAAYMFGQPPRGLALSTGAHPDHPVLVESLVLNGAELNRMENLLASGWANPKGAGHALLSMPIDSGDRRGLTLTARWTDLSTNIGYSGQIIARMSELTTTTASRRIGDVIVLFGPDGYLELATSAPPDETGQYNGRIITTTCGTAAGGLPASHWIWDNGRYLNLRDQIGQADAPHFTHCGP
jgi:hypothetical protein